MCSLYKESIKVGSGIREALSVPKELTQWTVLSILYFLFCPRTFHEDHAQCANLEICELLSSDPKKRFVSQRLNFLAEWLLIAVIRMSQVYLVTVNIVMTCFNECSYHHHSDCNDVGSLWALSKVIADQSWLMSQSVTADSYKWWRIAMKANQWCMISAIVNKW